MKKLKVALVHDYLNQWGGAENVLKELSEIFPCAPIFTLLFDPQKVKKELKGRVIYTSFVQRLPFSLKFYREFSILYPLAIETFDLRNFDLIISSTSGFAHGIIPPPNSIHISYFHTPLRYAFHFYHEYRKNQKFFSKITKDILLHYFRIWSFSAVNRVDYFIANSRETKRRIELYFNKKARVIFPPVDTDFFKPSQEEKDNFFIFVGRIRDYKRLDLAISATRELGYRLFVVGDYYKGKKIPMGEGVRFLGTVSKEDLRTLYQKARALIMPGLEDFGIVPLEANACGTPVIAFKGGGALDTVIDGETGVFFEHQNKDSLIEAILKFEKLKFDKDVLVKNALRFSKERFREEIKEFINEVI
ncbi:MAG: glycosyltransferase [candidate division WOR-3 bacterium]